MKTYLAIGMMSGTSLDGVDLVYVKFDVSEKYLYKILFSETIPYSVRWKKKITEAFKFEKDKLTELDVDYANLLSDLIVKFIKKNKIDKVDFIASHGHTIHHQPEKRYTLQIGNGQVIFNRTGIKTVCDFRSQDVMLGGQGAPLVPIGDTILFSEYDYCLNLGGFANISFDVNKSRIAYDICPVNIVLNYFATKLGYMYDDKGNIARQGKINKDLLKELNNLDFYVKGSPKSLGFEFVSNSVFPIIEKYHISTIDILRTFIEHIALQISSNLEKGKKIFVTGGGVFNDFLIERIKHHSLTKIIIPDKTIINFKEALIFAFLGLRKIENKINCLKSVTGAEKNHCSGVIFEN
jgi:anhydro-N-acetylmuramic acid kinase